MKFLSSFLFFDPAMSIFNSCQMTSTETWADMMYHSESGFIFIWIYLQPTCAENLLKERHAEKHFKDVFFFPSRAFEKHGSHSFQSNPFNFFCLCKYSLVHCLLASAGLRSGRSIKLMFFPFCSSCCGLNLSVLSWPDHLSDRFLICFPHFPVEEGLSLFGLDWNWFCSDLQPPQPLPFCVCFCFF